MTDTTEQRPRALAPGTTVPELIEIDEFVLRRYTLGATSRQLHEAIKASATELAPWMPWCVEPIKIEDQRDFVDRASLKWVTGEAFDFGIFDADGLQIGSVSLMDRVGPGGLEIGYWLRTGATGKGRVDDAGRGPCSDRVRPRPARELPRRDPLRPNWAARTCADAAVARAARLPARPRSRSRPAGPPRRPARPDAATSFWITG